MTICYLALSSDYARITANLTFNEDISSVCFNYTSLDDVVSENNEVFIIRISSRDEAMNISTPELYVTIVDNEIGQYRAELYVSNFTLFLFLFFTIHNYFTMTILIDLNCVVNLSFVLPAYVCEGTSFEVCLVVPEDLVTEADIDVHLSFALTTNAGVQVLVELLGQISLH